MDQGHIWEVFQNPAQEIDPFVRSAPRYEFIARRFAAGQHVLNIGVGRGGLEGLLIKEGVTVSCLDPGEQAVESVRTAYQLGDRAKVGLSQAMPFGDREFDAVVMSEVLEHLDDAALAPTMVQVKRVLKPGGLLIGTVPANEVLAENYAVCPHCGQTFHRWGHAQSFSPTRVRQLLESGGFIVQRLQVRCFPDWRRSGVRNLCKSAARYLLGRLGSPLAYPSIYFEATADLAPSHL